MEKNTTMSSPSTHQISHVQFCVWSAEDIKRQSCLNLTEFGAKNNSQAFLDGRFGSVDSRTACWVCRQTSTTCTGHWGHIDIFRPIPNPFFIKNIKDVLQCFCRKCSALLYTKDRIELNNMHKIPGDERIKEIAAILVKSNGSFFCPNKKCCTPVNEIFVKDDKTFIIRYSAEGSKKQKTKQLYLEYDEIYQMFKNISNADLQTIGFNEHLIQAPEYTDPSTFTHGMMTHRHQNRPEDFFITILPVLPLCIRPCVSQGKEIKHDGATILYQLILKAVKHLKEAKSEKDAQTASETIQKLIFALIKQKGDDTSKKSYNSIFNRLSSKEGHIRGAVESKRADYGARSVAGNAPYLPFGGVEIPQEMTKITQVTAIIDANIVYWNSVLKADRIKMKQVEENYKRVRNTGGKQVIYLTQKPEIFYEPTIQYIIRNGKKTSSKGVFITELKVGDVVHRKLRDGDMCIVNRQPTIRKESFNSHRVYICPKASKRTNCVALEVCRNYNMD